MFKSIFSNLETLRTSKYSCLMNSLLLQITQVILVTINQKLSELILQRFPNIHFFSNTNSSQACFTARKRQGVIDCFLGTTRFADWACKQQLMCSAVTRDNSTDSKRAKTFVPFVAQQRKVFEIFKKFVVAMQC